MTYFVKYYNVNSTILSITLKKNWKDQAGLLEGAKGTGYVSSLDSNFDTVSEETVSPLAPGGNYQQTHQNFL